MKPYPFSVIAFFLLTSTISCRQEHRMRPKLQEIERTIVGNPTKAVLKLAEIHPNMQHEPLEDQMKYNLLRTKADDKAFNLHTTDSIMRPAAEYYTHHGSPQERLEAFYYMGSVYRDLHDSPKAIKWYTKAAEYGEEHLQEVDSISLAAVYSQISYVMGLQGNPRASVEAAKRQFVLDSGRENDWEHRIDLASDFAYNGQQDSAIIYYRKAIELCTRPNTSAHSFTNVIGSVLNIST